MYTTNESEAVMRLRGAPLKSSFAVLMLFAAGAFGQANENDEEEVRPPSVTIIGTVLEEGSRVPVSGAYVTLLVAGSRDSADIDFVNEAGTFALAVTKPGRYVIRTKAEGFVETIYPDSGPGIEVDEAAIQKGGALFSVTLTVRRLGVVAGRVQDSRTGIPIASLEVQALRMYWFRGQRAFAAEGMRVRTDAGGAFRLEKLPAGEYFVEISPPSNVMQTGGGLRLSVEPSEPGAEDTVFISWMEGAALDEKQASDHAFFSQYPATYWPPDPEAGAPMDLSKGGLIDLGKIGLNRTKPAVVRGNERSECTDDWVDSVSAARILGATVRSEGGVSACGPFTLPPLPAGRHRIVLSRFRLKWSESELAQMAKDLAAAMKAGTTATALSAREQAAVEDIVVDAGSEVSLSLEPRNLPRFEGRIACDCRDTAGAVRTISLAGLDGSGAASFDVAGDGSFGGVAPIGSGQAVAVDRLLEVKSPANGLYVKSVALDGAEVGPYFQFKLGRPVHTLAITLSDRPSSVAGRVTRSGKPAAGDTVVVAQWPKVAADGFSSYVSAPVASDGTFAIAGLAPGTFRAVSVAPETWGRIQMPVILSSLLSSSGVDLTLAEGESKSLSIEAEAH